MDYPVQDLQFLDLTDANEDECNFIHTTLFTRNPNLKYPDLPWAIQPDYSCAPTEWRPAPYATGEPTDVPPGAVTAALVDGGICDSTEPQNVPSPATHQIPGDVSQEPQNMAGSGSHTNSVYPVTSVMSVPPQVPTSVPTAPPPVMTTMYHQIVPTIPLSNVYVGNVTANVNVHGYMSAPLGTYQQIPQQVYASEVPHEQATPPLRSGRDSRRGRPNKPGNKRVDGQYGDRNSGVRHSQDVIPTQPPPLVESPPTGNSNMPPQSFPQFVHMSPMHHAYQPQYYNSSSAAHPAPHHLTHPSAHHATGTPIYLPPAMYPPLYTYQPHPQPPGAPPIMPYQPMQAAPVPTTETSVLGYQVENSGVDERMMIPPPPPVVSSKEVELVEANVHQPKQSPSPEQSIVCVSSYQPESMSEVCQQSLNTNGDVTSVNNNNNNNAKPTSYQQQQSEEDEYNQANLMNTVVVNNSNISNIVTEPIQFMDSKQGGVMDSNRNLPQIMAHQNFISDGSSSFVSEVKISNSEVIDEGHVTDQKPRVISSESSVNSSVVVNEHDLKRDKANVTIPPAAVKVEKCPATDVKPSLPQVDVPTSTSTPKASLGPQVESVAPFSNSTSSNNTSVTVQHQTSGQTTTVLAPASHPAEIPSTPVSTPVQTVPAQKSWASLFKPSDSTVFKQSDSFEDQMIGTSSKPLACVKPFQNTVPVNSDISRKAETSTVQSMSPSSHAVNISGDNVKGFPQLPSPSSDDPHMYRLGEFLSKYQLEHKALSLQPRGLTNRSNWCYINSTLQALLACPPFYNLMKALSVPQRRSGKSTTPIIDSMVQFVNEFMPLSAANRLRDRKEKAMRKDDGSIEIQCGAPFEPSYIYKMLNSIRSDTFKVEGRQEDAEEFLGCLLNALNDEMLELIKLVEEPATKTTLINGDIATNGDASVQSQDEDDTEWKVMGPKNKGSITRRADFGRTPISDIFRGQLRSRVQRAGDQSTDNVQPFFTLQLDIEKAQSVKDALDLLVGKDQLEGVTCSRTNQEIEAWQTVSLEELPLVLLLHLKWFDYKMDGASKIVKFVEFPIELKVDTRLMSSNKKCGPKQRQYKLFAVVYHDGKEATKGHYITDVFHVGYGGWVRYDDSVVKAVQESNVLRPRGPRVPYLLYYRRCDTIGNTQSTPSTDKAR